MSSRLLCNPSAETASSARCAEVSPNAVGVAPGAPIYGFKVCDDAGQCPEDVVLRGIDEVTQYVLSLSGRATISELADAGKAKYEMFCAACHGADGTGNVQLGAPNLTDDVWLYGGSITRISESLRIGRNGIMPAQGEFLGDAKIHLLTAYIYSLSQQ